MKIEKRVKGMMESNLVPEDDYDMVVNRVKDAGESGWEVAVLGFKNPSDKELKTKTIDFFICNNQTGTTEGLRDLLLAAQLTELPEDENGEQDTKTSLPGVEFPARVTRGTGKRGPTNWVNPIIDWDWVKENVGDDDDEEDEAPRGRRKKVGSKKKKGPSRSRRR
jgi:hypothetical protein